ncbi:MAG: glycosyltransferase [Rectinemataceae bacterium]
MARILFVTWNGGGNQSPALGLARALKERGHDVDFVGQETQKGRFEAAGFTFTVFPNHPGTEPRCLCGTERQSLLMRDIWMNCDLADDVAEVLSRKSADLLVVDCMLVGILAKSRCFQVPTAVLVHSLFASTLKVRDSMIMFGNKLRAQAGLSPLDESEYRWESKDLALITTLREFDDELTPPLPRVRYVGPVFEQKPVPTGWHLPWEKGDPRPLVLVSFSTNKDQGSEAALQGVLDALEHLPARILLTTGGAFAPAALHAPSNAAVYGFIPHEVVLPHADLMLTHGGHGSVMAALAYGVPLVCKPSVGTDQPIIAARVEAVGVGRAVSSTAGGEELRYAVEKTLRDPSSRTAAGRLRELIGRENGALRGAVELEACLSVSNPV